MRNKLLFAVLAIVAGSACDPTIQKFEVVPDKLQCPGNVTLSWQGQADGGRLVADQPVSPALPGTVLKEGMLTVKVTQTTNFKFFYPSAAERVKAVTVVGGPQCGGPGTCTPSALPFTGQCTSANQGPAYNTQSISAAAGPGAITMITSDADFPVHVQHAGQDIALGAGGGPIFPLPNGIPAAGSYTITVPGQVGLNICKDAGPTSGTVDAPPVTIHVTPTCPKP
jgi:hypothetical protein